MQNLLKVLKCAKIWHFCKSKNDVAAGFKIIKDLAEPNLGGMIKYIEKNYIGRPLLKKGDLIEEIRL